MSTGVINFFKKTEHCNRKSYNDIYKYIYYLII
jgi:hypothetical protein